MQVVVNTLLTQYQVSGKGEKYVLLLHGWGVDMRSLAKIGRALAGHYQVIALDLPGFGGSQQPPTDFGLQDYSEFITDFLEKINIHSLYAIIGHSNGGAITIYAVGQHILEPQRVILLASSGIREVYRGKMKAIRLVTKTGKLLTTPLPKSLKRRLKEKVYKTVGSDMLVAERMQGTFKKIVTDDVQKVATSISQPVLLIYGEEDRTTPPDFGRQFHELMPNSTLEIVGQAGHFVYDDQPAAIDKMILDFLL